MTKTVGFAPLPYSGEDASNIQLAGWTRATQEDLAYEKMLNREFDPDYIVFVDEAGPVDPKVWRDETIQCVQQLQRCIRHTQRQQQENLLKIIDSKSHVLANDFWGETAKLVARQREKFLVPGHLISR